MLLGSVPVGASAADETNGADVAIPPECAAFAADKDADLGEVLKAGCKPTVGQMSALMDNPPEQSIGGMISVIDTITLDQSGSFVSWDGNITPW